MSCPGSGNARFPSIRPWPWNVPDPRAERDALIAATALVHGMTVVTRNAIDFEITGVELVDPWTGT